MNEVKLHWGNRNGRVGIWLTLSGEARGNGSNLHNAFHQLAKLAEIYLAVVGGEITDDSIYLAEHPMIGEQFKEEPLQIKGFELAATMEISWELGVQPHEQDFEKLKREAEQQMVIPILNFATYLFDSVAESSEREQARLMHLG